MLNLSELLSDTMASLSIEQVLITIITTVLLGLVIGYTYKGTTEAGDYTQGFFHTLVMVPALIGLIIMLIGSNVAGAFSLAGAFSIIRFRSTQGNPKDISFVLFAVAAGLACGVGCYLYAVIFTIILCVIIFVFKMIRLGVPKKSAYVMKITIPESLNFKGIFDEVLGEYSSSYRLTKIKTADMGSVFELSYDLELNDDIDTKELMDKIRCKNGNLTVLLSLAASNGQ